MPNERTEHGQPGHLNIYTRDHDSVITGFGTHDRVVAFHPKGDELYCRVDHKWKLGMPTEKQMLTVFRKDQYVTGRWVLEKIVPWDDGMHSDVIFRRLVTKGRSKVRAQ